MKIKVSYVSSNIVSYFFKIACASINHTSFYKTRNPVFAFLLSFIENFSSEKTAIVRKKHVSIMATRKVTQYGFLILL